MNYEHLDFPAQLQLWQSGQFQRGDYFTLGRPSPALLSAGFDDFPVTMTPSVANKILSVHGLTATDLSSLPAALDQPIMVFDSQTQLGSKVLLTQLNDRDNHVVAVELGRTLRGQTVNDVRSIYSKDARIVEMWIDHGLNCYAHPQKSQVWLQGQAPSNSERLTAKLGLSSLTNFPPAVNPTLKSKL